ncbi:hypothetical protein OIU77_009352 [Salix suchowensis]|uniref:Uncharacterized protein n=1 Tax=Salix suchowensis TaxID=1278906 RepID=A0ABQ9AE10_9ROSI|nr:hypothetical protein OIU77_009352 [Salix suchowensis]
MLQHDESCCNSPDTSPTLLELALSNPKGHILGLRKLKAEETCLADSWKQDG